MNSAPQPTASHDHEAGAEDGAGGHRPAPPSNTSHGQNTRTPRKKSADLQRSTGILHGCDLVQRELLLLVCHLQVMCTCVCMHKRVRGQLDTAQLDDRSPQAQRPAVCQARLRRSDCGTADWSRLDVGRTKAKKRTRARRDLKDLQNTEDEPGHTRHGVVGRRRGVVQSWVEDAFKQVRAARTIPRLMRVNDRRT